MKIIDIQFVNPVPLFCIMFKPSLVTVCFLVVDLSPQTVGYNFVSSYKNSVRKKDKTMYCSVLHNPNATPQKYFNQ